MPTITNLKKTIREEIRGKVMRDSIHDAAIGFSQELDNSIHDTVGNLIGKIITDFPHELDGYAFDQIYDKLYRAVKKTLKN